MYVQLPLCTKLMMGVVSPSPLPLPQSVTKHVHDIQQSLNTQVPGKVIKLWKEHWRCYRMPSQAPVLHEADGTFRIPAHLSSHLRFHTWHPLNIGNWLLTASPYFPRCPSLQWKAVMPARGLVCRRQPRWSHDQSGQGRANPCHYHISVPLPPTWLVNSYGHTLLIAVRTEE